MSDDHEFSIRAMKLMIKNVTTKRVGEPAADLFGYILNQFGSDIAEEAVDVAAEDGRKTVRAEDIREAKRRLDL